MDFCDMSYKTIDSIWEEITLRVFISNIENKFMFLYHQNIGYHLTHGCHFNAITSEKAINNFCSCRP